MVKIIADKAKGSGGVSPSTKVYVLIALATLFGALSSYFFNMGALLYGTIFLVLFLTFFMVESLFVYTKLQIATAVAINAVAFSLPFLRLISIYFVIGFILLFLFLFLGAYRGRREIDNMVKIKFPKLVRVISGSLITAVVLFLSIVVILSSNFSISMERVDQIVRISTPLVSKFIEGFDANINTGDLLARVTEKQLESSDEFSALSARDKQAVINEQIEELKAGIEEWAGASINLDATVTENIHNVVDMKLSSLTPRAQIYWSAALIATVWLSVQGVEFLVYIPLAILVFLVYELLFAMGFAVIQMESRSKEIISLK